MSDSMTRLGRDEINRLLDLALQQKRQSEPRFGEYALFRQALGDTQETDVALHVFLHDVETCPEEVLSEAQRLLAKKSFHANEKAR